MHARLHVLVCVWVGDGVYVNKTFHFMARRQNAEEINKKTKKIDGK